MDAECPNCGKILNAKRVSTWTRKLVKNDYRDPKYMPDDDNDGWDLVGYGKYVEIQKYHRVLLPLHKRGLLRRRRCRGSRRNIIKRGRNRRISR